MISYFNKSAGVYFQDIDNSAYDIGQTQVIGACLVTPTLKGKTFVPTQVTSYLQYADFFGTSFKSGSDYYEYQGSLFAKEYFDNGGQSLLVVPIKSGSYSPANSTINSILGSGSIVIETLNDGAILNNSGSEIANSSGSLTLGTPDNIRWEVTNSNTSTGTFTLLVRRGDDNAKSKIILEQFDNLSLDPTSTNYISNQIGDSVYVYDAVQGFVQKSGSFDNKSKYIRVKDVLKKTPNYFDNAGNVVTSLSGSIPANASGSFSGGSDGIIAHPQAFFETISGSNSQGYTSDTTAYDTAITILSNTKEYQYNLLVLSGVTAETHPAIVTKAFAMIDERKDTFAIVDAVSYGKTYTDAINVAKGFNTKYGALYFNHAQIQSSNLNKAVWVTPTTVMGGAYAYVDNNAQPFYVPAGYNNALLSNVIRTQGKLSKATEDSLEVGNVNYISYHPRFGYVGMGQNTLQLKATSTDRINVVRMTNKVKQEIEALSLKYLYELNNEELRVKYKAELDKYLQSVVRQNGLETFQVTLPEDRASWDRNELPVTIELVPLKAVEKIVITFILRTSSASFN